MSKSNQMETTKTKSNVKQQGAAVQNELVIHRVFNLPVNKVWRALTEAEEFKNMVGAKRLYLPVQ